MLQASDAHKWLISERTELKENEKNETLGMTHLSERDLEALGYEIITATWVYKPKISMSVHMVYCLDKRKSRLCAKGCDQSDSHEKLIYVATPPVHVVRLIIILATECNLRPQQADVESAFQIPVLESKIAIRRPEGMEFQGMKLAILNKTMQGLRQSSTLWGDLLHEFFMQYDKRIVCSIKAGK